MLIVLAKAEVGDGAIAAARDAIAAMVKASNAEDGCLSYTFTQDILDPSTMYIVEKWKDEAALVAHFQAPHMAAFQQALGELDVQVSEAIKYQADDGAPLM